MTLENINKALDIIREVDDLSGFGDLGFILNPVTYVETDADRAMKRIVEECDPKPQEMVFLVAVVAAERIKEKGIL